MGTQRDDAEAYAVWCDHIRELFCTRRALDEKGCDRTASGSTPGMGVCVREKEAEARMRMADVSHDSITCAEEGRSCSQETATGLLPTDDAEMVAAKVEETRFPWCFYARMLSAKAPRANCVGHEDLQASFRNANGLGGSNCQEQAVHEPGLRAQQERAAMAEMDDDGEDMGLAEERWVVNTTAMLRRKLEGHDNTTQVNAKHDTSVVSHGDILTWPFCDAKVEILAASINEELMNVLRYVRRQNVLAEQLRAQLLQGQLLLQTHPVTDSE